ncbi:MAG: AAA family ATPase [Prevotellaceae bacterium]|jgi:predicted ATP-dependent endonuclease of OLD family|nr:AAA family ATPase [Prevotellaceae bacterium]
MYIQKIHIKNYRNFNDFTMNFQKGLNVIIGANNSGKTGLLYAIRLLNKPEVSFHDFNRHNLLKYVELYTEDAPKIEIEYTIRHEISESNTEDESIIKLLSFLGMKEIRRMQNNESKVKHTWLIVQN